MPTLLFNGTRRARHGASMVGSPTENLLLLGHQAFGRWTQCIAKAEDYTQEWRFFRYTPYRKSTYCNGPHDTTSGKFLQIFTDHDP
ncbi:hypothetical protein AVEN_107712-1 [Araneus ventricosus]|nr:hypothetical protein AVEN_107712-1 [Araneus ventricosus]